MRGAWLKWLHTDAQRIKPQKGIIMDTIAKLNLTILAVLALMAVDVVANLAHGANVHNDKTIVAVAPVAQVVVSAKRLSAKEKAEIVAHKSV